jgi:hypothetical protein
MTARHQHARAAPNLIKIAIRGNLFAEVEISLVTMFLVPAAPETAVSTDLPGR